MKKIYIGILIILFSIKLQAQSSILIGPMFHWNLNDYSEINWGIEISYWSYSNHWTTLSYLKGFDVGFEFSEGIFRIYSEFQVANNKDLGISIGIIEEFSKYAIPKTGIQGSAWGALFLGADLPYRYFVDENYFAPGLFLKIPISYKLKPKSGSSFSNINFM